MEPPQPAPATRREGFESPQAGRGAVSGDVFPRSATMRMVLKHPAMALGVGVPAAALLLSSPAARRILAAVALRAGPTPELRGLLQASAAALEFTRTVQQKSAK